MTKHEENGLTRRYPDGPHTLSVNGVVTRVTRTADITVVSLVKVTSTRCKVNQIGILSGRF